MYAVSITLMYDNILLISALVHVSVRACMLCQSR
jgi:hypothetical protein